MVLSIVFADLYIHKEAKGRYGGLPVADAALQRNALFQ
jgi:hypothetical protein